MGNLQGYLLSADSNRNDITFAGAAVMTDQEEAQCREALTPEQEKMCDKIVDELLTRFGMTSAQEVAYRAYAAGLASRRKPVMGEVYIEEDDDIFTVRIARPNAPSKGVAYFLTLAEAEQYLSQFPKREGQDVGESVAWTDGHNLKWMPGYPKVIYSGKIPLYTKLQPDNSSAESAPNGDLK